MASGSSLVPPPLLLSLLVAGAVVCLVSTTSAASSSSGGPIIRGWKVGGWTVIRDVRENKEVQNLGLFAVQEHNRRLGPGAGAGDRLVFGGVVRAKRQVVSGIKYYLRIVAVSDREAAGGAFPGDGHPFDAVVVIKAWLEHRELLSFAPSSSNSFLLHYD